MKNQSRTRLALRKETVRTLNQLELADVAGGIYTTFTQLAPACTNGPSVRLCLTTFTTTNP
jgi:hypothetical protein